METVINLWNAYAELLTGRPHDTITATGWVGVASVTGMIVLLVLPAAYYLASYPLRRLGRWWRGRRVDGPQTFVFESPRSFLCYLWANNQMWLYDSERQKFVPRGGTPEAFKGNEANRAWHRTILDLYVKWGRDPGITADDSMTVHAASAPSSPDSGADRYRVPSTPESRAFFSPEAMAERAKLFADEPDLQPYLEDRPCEPPNMVPRSHFRPGIFGDGMTTLNLPMGELPPMEILVPDDVLDAKRTAALFAKSAGGVVPNHNTITVRRDNVTKEPVIVATCDSGDVVRLGIPAMDGTPIKHVAEFWPQRTDKRVAELADRLAALESARAGEGVRAWTCGMFTVLQSGPDWFVKGDKWMVAATPADRFHGTEAGYRELPHAEALRLDAERRGQAPIDWQFKGGMWRQYRNGKWIACDPPDSAVAHPAPEG